MKNLETAIENVKVRINNTKKAKEQINNVLDTLTEKLQGNNDFPYIFERWFGDDNQYGTKYYIVYDRGEIKICVDYCGDGTFEDTSIYDIQLNKTKYIKFVECIDNLLVKIAETDNLAVVDDVIFSIEGE